LNPRWTQSENVTIVLTMSVPLPELDQLYQRRDYIRQHHQRLVRYYREAAFILGAVCVQYLGLDIFESLGEQEIQLLRKHLENTTIEGTVKAYINFILYLLSQEDPIDYPESVPNFELLSIEEQVDTVLESKRLEDIQLLRKKKQDALKAVQKLDQSLSLRYQAEPVPGPSTSQEFPSASGGTPDIQHWKQRVGYRLATQYSSTSEEEDKPVELSQALIEDHKFDRRRELPPIRKRQRPSKPRKKRKAITACIRGPDSKTSETS